MPITEVVELHKNAIQKGPISGPPSQFVAEGSRDAKWYYDNIKYISTFYNQKADYLGWPDAGSVAGEYSSWKEKMPPVQEMIRMLKYYLGEQPNMNYAFAADDVTGNTMQALWTQSQTVKEFVDFFRGGMRGRLANAVWSGKPLSKRASTARTNMFDKAMVAYDLKPFLQQMMEQDGVGFDPSGQSFELPEQVQKWLETDWKEFGAEVCSDMATGIWHTENWMQKCLMGFLYCIATCNVEMHHFSRNGRMTNEILMPYQTIRDLRVDGDYGEYDEFSGKVGYATPLELKRLFPEITDKIMEEIEKIASDNAMWGDYNEVGLGGFQWWGSVKQRGMVGYITGYWRTKHFTGLKSVKRDSDRLPRVAKTDKNGEKDYICDDIATSTVIGNRWVLRNGYTDNMVETLGDVSRPVMPIIRFRPNTVLGQAKSEVKRISALVDECDYYAYKIKEMVGKAKGKTYVIFGEKFSSDNTPKEFVENITTMGFTILPKGSGEINDKDSNIVEMLDFSLDPNINKLYELIVQKEDKMKKIMSTSDLAMGQPQTYFGNNTMNTAISQNTIGTKYLIDGYLDWITLNMRYAVNATKNLMVLGDENKEMEFYVGDRGLIYLKLFPELTFEQIGISLTINDIIDDQAMKDTLQAATMLGQTTGMTFNDFLQARTSRTFTEMQNKLDFSEKKRKQEGQQQMAAEQQNQERNIQMQQIGNAMIADNKEANENYRKMLQENNANLRKEMELSVKGMLEQMKMLVQTSPQPQAPPSLTSQVEQLSQPQQ